MIDTGLLDTEAEVKFAYKQLFQRLKEEHDTKIKILVDMNNSWESARRLAESAIPFGGNLSEGEWFKIFNDLNSRIKTTHNGVPIDWGIFIRPTLEYQRLEILGNALVKYIVNELASIEADQKKTEKDYVTELARLNLERARDLLLVEVIRRLPKD